MNSRIIVGDCREALRALPDASVHCCVTSPPYFGLRDYGTAEWEGGDVDCDHTSPTRHQQQGKAGQRAGRSNVEAQRNDNFRSECPCGARRVDRQMGLERTPEEYIANMVEVFREVRRVLRDDGTLWLNIGDSYAGSGRGGYIGDNSSLQGSTTGQDNSRMARGSQKAAGLHETARITGAIGRAWVAAPPGTKQKDLIGIPWMLAFALRADGWYLRQDIIWSKPNPMPESVRDRCTKAHEYLFLLSKSAHYYFDAEAIAEPVAPSTIVRLGQDIEEQGGSERVPGKKNGPMKAVPPRFGGSKYGDSESNAYLGGSTRNRRSVWTVATQPFKEAHFATFPPALIEPCILAGCPRGGACSTLSSERALQR